MKTSKKSKGNINSLLMKNYIAFTCFFALGGFAIYFAATHVYNIMMKSMSEEEMQNNVEKIVANSEVISVVVIVSFILLYLILITLFIIRMNRTIKSPLILLDNAIIELTNGTAGERLEYEGPQELVQICDSFNKLQRQLEISERRRKEVEDEKQKMLADISHDLKTPITVIQGYSKAICDGMVQGEKSGQYMETIYKKSCSMSDLITSFHEYSKIQHPDYALHKKSVDMCEFCREYIAQKYSEFEAGNYQLEVDIPEEIHRWEIDEKQFVRVFDNLIGNFMKHNEPGCTLYFQLRVEGNEVVITIADDGTGIPANYRDQIFQAFVMADEARHSGNGSGLGLAIVKKIVEAHGGTITLIDPEKSGYATEFRIVLSMS